MKRVLVALSALLLAASCSKLDPLPDGGLGPVDAGEPPPPVDAGFPEWAMSVHADVTWAATAQAQATTNRDPTDQQPEDAELVSKAYEVEAVVGETNAHARIEVTRADRAITFAGNVSQLSQLSQGADATAGAWGTVTQIRVCLQARDAKKFRRTFECTGTVDAATGGGAAIRAVTGSSENCSTGRFPDGDQGWQFTNAVTEIDAVDGAACFDQPTTVTFGVGGGTEGPSSSSADGTITLRFEPLYE